MSTHVVSSEEELIAAVCKRRDELQLSHEAIDHLAGLSDRYLSKVIGPSPARGFGEMSLGAVLGALALQVAVVVLIEDPEQARAMRPRWQVVRRRRPRRRREQVGCVVADARPPDCPSNERNCDDQTGNNPCPRE
jgi:hypothetical protein